MPTELAPAQLAEEFFNVASGARIAVGSETRGVPDLSRADFTEPQMRRQVRRPIPIRPVATGGITGDILV
jgi:hypothetical protein